MILFGLTVPGLLIAQNTDALDAQNGFFDLRLGADLSEFQNLEKKSPQLKRDRYRWKTCPRAYAGVKIAGIELLFYKNRLHSIVISLANEVDAKNFQDLLEIYYGPGDQLGMAPHFTWSGKAVKLTYEKNLFTKQTTVIFESVEMQHLYSQDYHIH